MADGGLDGETPRQAGRVTHLEEQGPRGRTGKKQPEYGHIQQPSHKGSGSEFIKHNWPGETCSNITEVEVNLKRERADLQSRLRRQNAVNEASEAERRGFVPAGG